MPALDEKKVFLMGYSMGSLVGLHAASKLKRIAGVAAFGGWTPFRSNGANASVASTGGNRMISATHALIPRLGLFEGNESAIPYLPLPTLDSRFGCMCIEYSPNPGSLGTLREYWWWWLCRYDYAELIASIAPRPVLLHSPRQDRFTDPEAVETAATSARKAWTAAGAEANFVVSAPEGPSNFQEKEVLAALHWANVFVK